MAWEMIPHHLNLLYLQAAGQGVGIPVLILGIFWDWASSGESWFSSTLSQAGCAKILFIFPISLALNHFTAPSNIQVFLEMFFSWWCREPRASKPAGIPVGFNHCSQISGLKAAVGTSHES